MEIKREQHVGDLVDSAASSELALNVEQEFQKLQEAMSLVCTMHEINSLDLVKEDELSEREVLSRTGRTSFNRPTLQFLPCSER